MHRCFCRRGSRGKRVADGSRKPSLVRWRKSTLFRCTKCSDSVSLQSVPAPPRSTGHSFCPSSPCTRLSGVKAAALAWSLNDQYDPYATCSTSTHYIIQATEVCQCIVPPGGSRRSLVHGGCTHLPVNLFCTSTVWNTMSWNLHQEPGPPAPLLVWCWADASQDEDGGELQDSDPSVAV